MNKLFFPGLPLAALIVGCSSLSPVTESDGAPSPATSDFEASLQAIVDSPPPPPRPTAAPAQEDLPPPRDEVRFDVDSNETDVRDFFRALVEGTPYNVVLHPEVQGTVTLTLNRVTVPEVLDVIAEVYGFSYRPGPAGYVIYPASIRTEIFEIDYLDLKRTGSSRTRVSSGQVSEGRGMGRGMNSMVGSFGAAPVAPVNGGAGQEISGSNIDTNYETDFWAELESTLTAMVGSEGGSQVVVNSQTGVIMVRAMPQALRSVADYLDTIQDVAQRQVVLEAKIIEVTLNESYSAGINWIAVAENSGGDTYTFGNVAPPPGFAGDLQTLGGQTGTVSPGNIVDSLPITSQGGAFTMAFDVGDFNAFLELLEVHGDTRVLSSPRVSTLNNQKAVIKAGTDEFFVTNVSSNTVTGASSTTSRDVELTPFFSGIALDVTPQISDAGEVTLHIHPTVSEVTDQEKNLTVSGQTDVLPLAFSEVRESDSIVKARSGQIIVIGGLMRNAEFDQTFGLPGLSRVPGVGRLFSSTRKVNRKTELVILLKPVVVDSDQQWSELARNSVSGLQTDAR